MRLPYPGPDNDFLADHVAVVLASYRHWTGRDLVDPALDPVTAARAVFEAPYAVLSHDTGSPPRFTYANRTALDLFERTWDEFVGLPSAESAAPDARGERQDQLDRVARDGFVDDYAGARVAASGRRFRISGATVFDLLDADGGRVGQAATFDRWEPLDEE